MLLLLLLLLLLLESCDGGLRRTMKVPYEGGYEGIRGPQVSPSRH